MDKLVAAGKSRTEALRLLRRRLSDVAYRALLADEHAARQHHPDQVVEKNLQQAA